jgi:SnoaL-like domain/NAD binding domain of 6-phosphogluconate dehydrogenase
VPQPGPDGIAERARAGAVYFDLTTNSLALVRRVATELAGRGVTMLDSSVSGGPAGAKEGTLAIMVGGGAWAAAQWRRTAFGRLSVCHRVAAGIASRPGMELGASDILQIQSLIADYVLSVDARDAARFRSLWRDDAVVRVNRDPVGLGSPLCGVDEIISAFQGFFDRNTYAPGTCVRHAIAGSRVEIVGDDEVAATSVMFAVRQEIVDGAIDIRVSRTGTYTDRIVRTGDRWLFAERTIAWDPQEREGVTLPVELYGAVPAGA